MIRFGASSVQTWPCFRSNLEYLKLDLGYSHISDMNITNWKFWFGKFKIKILIWECPKSDSEQSCVWSTTYIYGNDPVFGDNVWYLFYIISGRLKIYCEKKVLWKTDQRNFDDMDKKRNSSLNYLFLNAIIYYLFSFLFH